MLYVYMGAAIFYLLSIGGAGWYGLEQGKKIESAVWLEQDVRQREQVSKELSEAMQRVATQNEQKQNNVLKAINEKDNAINDLERRLADAHRVRIATVKSASCDADAVSRKDQNSRVNAVSSGQSGAGELRELAITDNQINDGLITAYREQETLKAYFRALREGIRDEVGVIK